MTADTYYEIVLYRRGTAGTITHTFNTSTTAVVSGSRNFIKNMNDISSFSFQLSNATTVATLNYLSTSFAGWSNSVTGALQMGDYVRYYLYPTSTGTKTQVFYGKIVELSQSTDGKLNVKAQDYLKKYDKECTKIFFSGYEDSLLCPIVQQDGAIYIEDLPHTDLSVPLANVSLISDDTRLEIGSDGGTWELCVGTTKVAQPFYATGEAIFGCKVDFSWVGGSYGGDSYATAAIYTDVGGYPGTSIVSNDYTGTLGTPGSGNQLEFSFTNANVPTLLIKGAKYWLVMYARIDVFYLPLADAGVRYSIGSVDNYVFDFYAKYNGTSWSLVQTRNFHVWIDYATKQTISETDYLFDDSDNTIMINKNVPALVLTQSYATTPERGIVSYFYGTINHATVAQGLQKLQTGMYPHTDSAQELTFNTFSTLGKKILVSMQELADVYEISGTWDGYQHCFAHYESSGNQYIGWGKRLKVTDTPAFVFAYATDTIVDGERRLIDCSGMKIRTDFRPVWVTVIGKASDGSSIPFTISDYSVTASFGANMEGFGNHQKYVDNNLTTLEDVVKATKSLYGFYNRNIWEGQIIVSGVYPDLFELDPTSASFGSGKVITLANTTMGITAQSFVVRGIAVKENQTEITITNVDILIDNQNVDTRDKGIRTEAFYAPVGLVSDTYSVTSVKSAVDTDTLYMQMTDISGNPIPTSTRVLCTKITDAIVGCNVYHAVFEADNGYSTHPYGVRSFYLYDALTGGTLITSASLYESSAPIKDRRIDKMKTSRLTVDVITRIS